MPYVGGAKVSSDANTTLKVQQKGNTWQKNHSGSSSLQDEQLFKQEERVHEQ